MKHPLCVRRCISYCKRAIYMAISPEAICITYQRVLLSQCSFKKQILHNVCPYRDEKQDFEEWSVWFHLCTKIDNCKSVARQPRFMAKPMRQKISDCIPATFHGKANVSENFSLHPRRRNRRFAVHKYVYIQERVYRPICLYVWMYGWM